MYRPPRHPTVCVLDIIGFVISVTLVAIYRPHLTTAVLPLAIACQYLVSCIHHWMPWNEWRSKIDRSVIFLVIGATYVPYWAGLLPASEAMQRLPWVGVAVVVGVLLVFFDVWETIIAMFWAVFPSVGLAISFFELQSWLPPVGLAAFWTASVLYGMQQIVFTLERPNPFPEIFGYREIQHTLLLAATTISSIVVLQYT